MAPDPKEITVHGSQMKIVWRDGHESFYDLRELRIACRCAACQNEWTGEKTLSDDAVPPDIHIKQIDPVGRYAIHIVWSDGHDTGIYSFEYLRNLCACPSCEPNA